MEQVVFKQGRAVVESIPAPLAEPGTILVANAYSCISAGTELAGLGIGGLPLWKRAMRQPANVAKAIEAARTIGPRRTWEMVQGQLNGGSPSGYSSAGVVLDVGSGIDDIAKGDLVACAGAGYANHASIIRVPRNLAVPVPDGIDMKDASTVTLGAIALQGVRRARPSMGEVFVVLGLGILGQLTVQLLNATGVRTIGIDLDASRVARASDLGMAAFVRPDDANPDEQVARLTDGLGADAVIITAASSSDAIMSLAFRMTRKKGRVVLVGDVGLNLNRGDFYKKEIDFFISTSYGPGRYDRNYEERGLDYPASYVRWTENRNMGEYLRLLAEKKVVVSKLIDFVAPIESAAEAYEKLRGDGRPLIALLQYPIDQHASRCSQGPELIRRQGSASRRKPGRIRFGLIGAGSFAQGMHLPNLARLQSKAELVAVASRNGVSANSVAVRYGAELVATDPELIISSPNVDAVIITTRHETHAALALSALEAGKHVLVEKPMCLTWAEHHRFEEALPQAAARGLVFLTGYNRRFSPYALRIAEIVRDRSQPMLVNYTMNAGFIPKDHWIQGAEGGGRNLGEACHIYDLMQFLIGRPVVSIQALHSGPNGAHYLPSDNFFAAIRFADGSIANLTYTAFGSRDYPKERCEIYFDGKTVLLDDYKRLTGFGLRGLSYSSRTPEKGQMQELEKFIDAVRSTDSSPIPLDQQLETSRVALSVEDSIRGET